MRKINLVTTSISQLIWLEKRTEINKRNLQFIFITKFSLFYCPEKLHVHNESGTKYKNKLLKWFNRNICHHLCILTLIHKV